MHRLYWSSFLWSNQPIRRRLPVFRQNRFIPTLHHNFFNFDLDHPTAFTYINLPIRICEDETPKGVSLRKSHSSSNNLLELHKLTNKPPDKLI